MQEKTSAEQRAALHRQIWQIANDVRGAIDGWDFKQYVLGALFYRFISEKITGHFNGPKEENINYPGLKDGDISKELIEDTVKTRGYYIAPSKLFCNVVKNAYGNESLNEKLKDVFDSIEKSARNSPSQKAIDGLFKDFDITSSRLGNNVPEKNRRLAAVLNGVAKLEFGSFEDSGQNDLFGDAYEFLISNYAANAGKSGGEFFTPQCVSRLIARLAMHGQKEINRIYDPACGSGSLLLQAKKQLDAGGRGSGAEFYGQEINHTTYNLARMNMFLHNVDYNKFGIHLGDTLLHPAFGDNETYQLFNKKPFDVIVSNPPYSVKWIGSDDPLLPNDTRFCDAGVLAPKSKADFAFVLHALNYLSSRGKAAIVCFPGIFYRGGAEQKIRQYLIDNDYVEAVIALAPNLFFGTSIAVNILVLCKSKKHGGQTQFIDASALFKKETNSNILQDEHIEQILKAFADKKDILYFARQVSREEIAANGYNLSVNNYIEAKDSREAIDINSLNAELKTAVKKIDRLRNEIDEVIAEIESRP